MAKKKNNEQLVLGTFVAFCFTFLLFWGASAGQFEIAQANVLEASEVEAEVVVVAEPEPIVEPVSDAYWWDYIEDGYTVSQCEEIKRIWEIGNWTDSFNDLTAPTACKAQDDWNEFVIEIVDAPSDYDGDIYIAYSTNPFPDTVIDELEGIAAAYLFNIGVINGYDDGEFKGENDVNRAQAAKFLLVARYSDVDELGVSGKFSDVEAGQWYVKYVERAALLGVIDGYSDGTFLPAETVNTVEFLKMLALNFELELNLAHNFTDVDDTQWYGPYLGIASKYNLFPSRGTELVPGSLLTRDEVAAAMFQYMSQIGL